MFDWADKQKIATKFKIILDSENVFDKNMYFAHNTNIKNTYLNMSIS
jgi:hypothetical protein